MGKRIEGPYPGIYSHIPKSANLSSRRTTHQSTLLVFKSECKICNECKPRTAAFSCKAMARLSSTLKAPFFPKQRKQAGASIFKSQEWKRLETGLCFQNAGVKSSEFLVALFLHCLQKDELMVEILECALLLEDLHSTSSLKLV